jgi:hypothetical protein
MRKDGRSLGPVKTKLAPSVGGLFHLPRRQLFALNIFRFGDISGRHFSQRYFRFVITDILGRGTHSWRPVLTFGGRTRKSDGEGEAMPQKETRESIEAALSASKRERIALQLQELVGEAHLAEYDLRSLEDEHCIPEFARSKSLPERMAAVGMSRAVIGRVSKFLDALDMVRQAGAMTCRMTSKANLPARRTPSCPAPSSWLRLSTSSERADRACQRGEP